MASREIKGSDVWFRQRPLCKSDMDHFFLHNFPCSYEMLVDKNSYISLLHNARLAHTTYPVFNEKPRGSLKSRRFWKKKTQTNIW